MLDIGFSVEEVSELLSAMLTVAPDRDEGHQPSRHFVLGIRDHLFKMSAIDLDALQPSTPESFNLTFIEPDKEKIALQILVLMPYLSGALHDEDVERVNCYASATGLAPDSLRDLNNIAHRRIKLALIDYFRRATNEFIPEKGLHKIWTLVKEVHGYIGDSKLAEEFEQLSSLDYGTLGKTIHTFYRARGFKFPGEPGNLTETAVRHDCVHILSGTNTDMAGEIAVSAIESGMANSEVGWEMITEVLLDFHLGIAWTLPQGIKAGTMNFDPELFSEALAIGAKINTDLIRDWNYWDDINTPILDLRKRFNIMGVSIVDMPAPGVDPTAKTTYYD